MDAAQYEALARLRAGNWWYEARRDLLDLTLRRHGPFGAGADLGCGPGANLPVLRRHCREVVGIDLSPLAVAACHERGFPEARQGDVTRLDLPAAGLDLVTCLDVLEHVDDGAAVAEVARVLRPGGLAVIAVPACSLLWNENDDSSHHLRRYSRAALRDLLADFHLRELGYWNGVMFAPALAYGLLRRFVPRREARNNLELVPGPAGGPLLAALRLENRLRRLLPPPVGTSLFAVAERP